MFILIAALITFIVVFLLLWPIRKMMALFKMILVISIPVLVCTYLWFNGFFEIPKTFERDNKKIALEIAELKEKANTGRFNIKNIVALNELYLESGELETSLELLKSELDKHPKNRILQLKMAESLVYLDDGMVKDETKEIFETLQQSRSREAKLQSEFYLNLYKAQQGDLYDALKGWQSVIKRSYADDPWLVMVVPAVRKVAAELNLNPVKEIPQPKLPRGQK